MKRLSQWSGDFRFSRMELSGSLGDLGTFLPLVVAMALACRLDVGAILVCAGLMNVLTGLLFRQPIPVQPMKAIAAIAITEGLLADEIVASGIVMGVLMVTLALSGAIDLINRVVPKAVVRGIQLGVGLKLAEKGVQWIGGLPVLGADGILTAVLAAVILLFLWARRWPAVLYVFLGGFLLLYLDRPTAYQEVAFALPHVRFHWPETSAWVPALLKAALPQAPLTVLNSVVAVCALSADYFPGKGISPRRMAASVGLMNLLCVPFGGIPMCHGAGGLAAQHLFGARTGGSVVMLGLLKIAAGLLFGGALLSLLGAYPLGILGLLLVFAGIELARAARDLIGSPELVIALVTTAFILGINTAAGFVVGCGVAVMFGIWQRGWGRLRPPPVEADPGKEVVR